MSMLPKIIEGAKLPIKMWCFNAEEEALSQASRVANHPFSFHHIALMPDVHSGYGLPIGGVAALDEVIIPFAIGLDIGCGMRACKTNIKGIDIAVLKSILGEIRQQVPVGFSHNQTANLSALPPMERKDFEMSKVVKTEWQSAGHQIGTLGGGK